MALVETYRAARDRIKPTENLCRRSMLAYHRMGMGNKKKTTSVNVLKVAVEYFVSLCVNNSFAPHTLLIGKEIVDLPRLAATDDLVDCVLLQVGSASEDDVEECRHR